jgi:hypothetical protein
MKRDDQTPPSAPDLLETVNELQRSSWTSITFLVIGALVVIGSFVFSLTQLNPLKRQVDEKKAELVRVNQDLTVAQARLDAVRGDIQKYEDKLKLEINKPNLPEPVKAGIGDALREIRRFDESLKETQKDLREGEDGQPPRLASFDDLFSEQPSVRVGAYRTLLEELTSDPTKIPELMKYARAHQDNEDGIYNTLVVLSHLNRDLLKPYVGQIQIFCRELQSGQVGPRIKDRIDKLLSRLPNNTAS